MKHIKLFENFNKSESIDVPGPELYRIAFDEKLKLAKDELEGYLQLFQDLECNCSIRIYSEEKYGKDYKSFDDISSEDFINHIKRTNRSYTLNDVTILLIISKEILMNTKDNKDEVLYLKNLLRDVKKNMKYTSFNIEDLSRSTIVNNGKNKNIKRYVLDLCFYSKENKREC
jgi:hypothetical protein